MDKGHNFLSFVQSSSYLILEISNFSQNQPRLLNWTNQVFAILENANRYPSVFMLNKHVYSARSTERDTWVIVNNNEALPGEDWLGIYTLCDKTRLFLHPTRMRRCVRIKENKCQLQRNWNDHEYKVKFQNYFGWIYQMQTRKISSSVTANVRSSFPDNWLISFCTTLVSIRIWKMKTNMKQNSLVIGG